MRFEHGVVRAPVGLSERCEPFVMLSHKLCKPLRLRWALKKCDGH
jgi:hypothetical protein